MKNKTKLLFINYNMKSGGAERSLLSLLNIIDYEKYEVDLMLFSKEGMFLKYVPDSVNIVEAGVYDIVLSILTNKTNLLRQWHNKKTHTKMDIQPTFCLYLLCDRCFGKVFLAYLN